MVDATQKINDFNFAFTGERGERVLKEIAKYCLENDCTFDKESGRKSDFNQGARSVILEIRHWLDMDITKLNK
ncbi:unnamed protein product, partial [marine sediment metagenome]